MHPVTVNANRPNNLCLDLNDIEGTKSNSTFAKAHFLDVIHIVIVEKKRNQELSEY